MQLAFAGRDGLLRYTFDEPMTRSSGSRVTPFGLDGVYRMSRSSFLYNLPTAARGTWTGPSDFELELNMAAFNHLWRIGIHLAGDHARVRWVDEGSSEAILEATVQ